MTFLIFHQADLQEYLSPVTLTSHTFSIFFHPIPTFKKRIFIGIVDAINGMYRHLVEDLIKDYLSVSMINFIMYSPHQSLLWQAGIASPSSISLKRGYGLQISQMCDSFTIWAELIKFMANENLWNNHIRNKLNKHAFTFSSCRLKGSSLQLVLLIAWATPMTTPSQSLIGVLKMLWVRYPICKSISLLNLGSCK